MACADNRRPPRSTPRSPSGVSRPPVIMRTGAFTPRSRTCFSRSRPPSRGMTMSSRMRSNSSRIRMSTFGNGMRRCDLVSVPVLEAGEEFPQHRDHAWLVIDDEDSLHHVRFTESHSRAPHVRSSVTADSTTRTVWTFPGSAIGAWSPGARGARLRPLVAAPPKCHAGDGFPSLGVAPPRASTCALRRTPSGSVTQS